MTKKKKIINGLIFLAGLIVFAVYYFEDDTDVDVVEEKQDEDAVEAADSMFNVFENEEFNELDSSQDSL